LRGAVLRPPNAAKQHGRFNERDNLVAHDFDDRVVLEPRSTNLAQTIGRPDGPKPRGSP
jgi:hypothetical protein